MFHIDPLARLEVEVKVFGVTADHETQKSRELWLSGTAQGQGHGYLLTYQTKVGKDLRFLLSSKGHKIASCPSLAALLPSTQRRPPSSPVAGRPKHPTRRSSKQAASLSLPL